MNPQATETEGTAEIAGGSHIPPTAPRRRHGSRAWAYTVPAIILALFGGLAYWRVQSRNRVSAELIPAAAETERIPVAVTHPTYSTASRELTIPGDVQAYVETPIYARTDGYLKQWYVDIGGHVKRGQLLATIDTPELDQQLRQARSGATTSPGQSGSGQNHGGTLARPSEIRRRLAAGSGQQRRSLQGAPGRLCGGGGKCGPSEIAAIVSAGDGALRRRNHRARPSISER